MSVSATTTSPTKKRKKREVSVSFVAGPGAPFREGEETIIGEVLEDHIRRYGVIKKEKLYEEVEADPHHPLRRFLQWDDQKAARRYRLAQLARIIRFIRYEVTDGEKVVNVRAYESVVVSDEIPAVDPGRSYVRTTTVVRHAALHQQLQDRARKELAQWRQNYEIHKRYLTDLRPIFDAIDQVMVRKPQ